MLIQNYCRNSEFVGLHSNTKLANYQDVKVFKIAESVCRILNIRMHCAVSPTKWIPAVIARRMAYEIMKRYNKKATSTEMAAVFNRSHSSVISNTYNHAFLMLNNKYYSQTFHELEKKIIAEYGLPKL